MNSKFLKALLLFGLMSLLLCGCNKVDNGEGILHHAPEPTHITENPEAGLQVDLDVVSPGGEVPKLYRIEIPPLDASVVDAFLAQEGDAEAEVRDDLMLDDIHIYNAKTKTGGIVGYWRSTEDSGQPVYSFSYSRPEFQEYTDVLRDYYGLDASMELNDTTALYTEPREFSFCSYAEAEAKATACLQSLGVRDLKLEAAYYIDHEIMNRYIRSEEAQRLLKDSPEREQGQEKQWDASVDAYYFHFTLEKDQIPVLQNSFQNTTTDFMTTTIRLLLNSSGIVYLSAENVFCFGDVYETPQSMADYSAVLERVKRVAQNTLTETERLLDGVQLQYACVQNGKEWLRVPVWVVTIRNRDALHYTDTYTGEEFTQDTHTLFLFDAITGKQIG